MRIGVDLGGTKIEAIALGGDGKPLARERVATPREDYAGTIDAVGSLVESMEERFGSGARVGMGTPGAISPATARIKNANSTWLNGMPFQEDLEARLGRPVRLANDADCFALSEAMDGAAAGAETVFGVILGTGVGGGLVVRGRLVRGPNAVAGEWGHNPLPGARGEESPGPPCYCGRNGCVETFLSGPGMAADHRRVTGERVEAPEIARRAEAGDGACLETLERHANRLARGLAAVINVIDPHVIVLGGGLSGLGHLYDRVPVLWGAHVFSDRVDTRLVPPAHGDSSGVRGAAWLWPE